MEEYKNQEELEKIDITSLLIDIGHGIRKFGWLVVLLALIFALRSYFSVSSSYRPQYIASATMAVESGDFGGASSYIDTQTAKQMASVFPYILTSGVLEDVVAEDMGLEYLPGSISASSEEGMNLFTLSVSANDPKLAYDILMSVIENYPKVAEFVLGETKLTILDETGIPEDTGREYVYRGSLRSGAIKGATIGLVIMGIYVVTRRTVKDRKKLKKTINLEDFGSIPFVIKKKRNKKNKNINQVNLLNMHIPQGYLEAIRKLQIKVAKEMEEKTCKSLLVTSSVLGEGKTTLACNLAIAMAKQGQDVILIDCDMRNPSVAQCMNIRGKFDGLGAAIRERKDAASVLRDVPVSEGRLRVLYGGKSSEKDSRLLGTAEMEAFIRDAESIADVVILDTAPSGLLADAPAMAKYVDAALYVVKYDHAKLRQIRDGVQALAFSGIQILGYVFNADKTGKSRGYGYGYGYGYKSYSGYKHYGSYGYGKHSKKQSDESGRVIKE